MLNDTRGRSPPTAEQPRNGRFPQSSSARVVYRSNNNANSNAGVSYTNANNDSSNTNAWSGSRLALKALICQNRKYIALRHRRRVATVEAGERATAQPPTGRNAETSRAGVEFSRASNGSRIT